MYVCMYVCICIEPDWDNYEKMLDVLYKEHPDAKDVSAHLGICHRYSTCRIYFEEKEFLLLSLIDTLPWNVTLVTYANSRSSILRMGVWVRERCCISDSTRPFSYSLSFKSGRLRGMYVLCWICL